MQSDVKTQEASHDLHAVPSSPTFVPMNGSPVKLLGLLELHQNMTNTLLNEKFLRAKEVDLAQLDSKEGRFAIPDLRLL